MKKKIFFFPCKGVEISFVSNYETTLADAREIFHREFPNNELTGDVTWSSIWEF